MRWLGLLQVKHLLEFYLLNLEGMGHLDLQTRIVRYSLLEVTGDVQPLIFLVRRFNLLGVSVLIRQGILRVTSLIILSTSGGNECCCLVKIKACKPEVWPVVFC